jgi:hypothetical protein
MHGFFECRVEMPSLLQPHWPSEIQGFVCLTVAISSISGDRGSPGINPLGCCVELLVASVPSFPKIKTKPCPANPIVILATFLVPPL